MKMIIAGERRRGTTVTQNAWRHDSNLVKELKVDKWMTCVDKDDIVGTLVLDFCKAFDLVNHDISLTKLSTYKLGNSALKLFTSYSQNRQQVMDSGKGYRNQPQLNHVCPKAPFWDLHCF